MTVILTTKKYAVSEYQKKLSAFSKDYKLYVKENKNKDDQIFYVINGIQVQGTKDEILKTLYNLTARKIKTVFFLAKYYKDFFNNKYPIVVIGTSN